MVHLNVVFMGQSLAWWGKQIVLGSFNEGKQKTAVCLTSTGIGDGPSMNSA